MASFMTARLSSARCEGGYTNPGRPTLKTEAEGENESGWKTAVSASLLFGKRLLRSEKVFGDFLLIYASNTQNTGKNQNIGAAQTIHRLQKAFKNPPVKVKP